MSMPSSEIAVTSSVTDATSQLQTNPSEKTHKSTQLLDTSQNSGINLNRCSCPRPSTTASRYSKQNRNNNPVPSTSKVDIERDEESLDCPNSPDPCASSCLPLSQAKSYICSCNPIDDPKPGPSTSAAEFDLEVFDSCSSCSLEDCWGPDCHHSSCESSPIASSTNTSVLIRSTGKNKTFHRKGNKRQLNSSGIPESSKPSSGLNNGDSSSEVFSVNHSKPRPSVYRQNFINHSKTTLGEFSDNSSEEDFIMSSPGRALPTHGQDYEPTSACPSETEEANLSDGREDDVEENDGSLYQKGTQNQYPRHNTNSLQEISNETSMDDINHDEVNQLTDVEEEGEQDGEIINASVFRDTISTSNISHNPELQKESRHYVNSGTECVQVEAESQTEDSEEHCNCYRQKSGPSPILPTAYYESASQCQEGLVLTTCHCSQMSTSDGILHIHDEKSRENHLVPSNLLNADPASMISCKSTTDYAHLGESLNSAHYPDDERKEHTQKTSAISSQKDPDAMSSSSVNPPAGDIDSHLNERSNEERTLTKTVTENTSKNSPLPSTSASATIASPQLPHCMCHSHVHHHHIHHHTPIHPPMSQRDVTVTNESTQIHSDKEPNIGGMESDTPLQKTPHKPLSSEKPLSGSSRSIKSPNRTIRGTTQDAMTADNVDEIVHDHDLFGTDENEDSLDSVATLSLNETTPSQEDEEASTTISFQFDIKIKESMDSMASTLNVLDADESSVENNLDTSGGLSGTKRKPDECAEDVSGPSNIKKKRTVAVSRRNSNAKCQASSLLNSTPKSAPRTSHINQVSIGTRCVSDVNMASAAFHLDDEKDHDNEEGGKPHNETQNSKEERNGGRNAGRQRYWSAGTLNTEEEICAGTTNAENKYCANIAHTKSDSLDIVPGLSTCETVALALPCSISASKNMFANVHNLCPSTNFCCKCRNEACPIASSSEEICLSDIEEKNTANISSLGTSISCPIRANTEKHDTIPFYTKQGDVDCCDVSESKCYNSNRSFHPSPSILYGSSHEAICCNNLQVSPSTQQQLTKLIPDKNYPPEDILDWKDSFSRWSNAKRLLAIDQLISMCEPQQVRHMMAVIEPQFQRDFISLLPKELSLYVLSFLKPRDLLNAAQTCRYWRILAEDNLLWREKCRESGLGDSVAEMFNARAKAHCKRGSNLSGIDYSSWKLGYMREHNIECNWRVKPIRTTKVLKGHDDHVITCLQFSNNKIVSGSDDNTLKVWNASTGRCLRTLVGHTGGVWSSQMEGNTIVSGSTDRSLKVWNADTGECVHTLYGHTSTVRCMHLHNNLVVSGSRDATLRMWDISSGECLHVLMGHVAAVRCVQYDGRLVVSGAYDYMVKVWNPITEECLHTLSGHTNRVYSLQFDGVHVVSGSLDTSIRVWDVETGSCKHALMGHQSLTSGMELKDNILVSGNADSTVKVWDITNGQCLQTLSGPNKHQSAVTCLQFDSKFVVTSSDDGTVKLWDVKTGEFIRDLVALKSGGSGGVVWRIRASPTKLVCAVGSRNGTEETKLLVLDFDAPLEK